MSYNPINWDEYTPITATLLDRMDTGINENNDDLATIQGGGAEVDGRISNNENDISNNENDISDFKDGTQSVAKATTIENIAQGKYVGDGNDARVISVGFTPKKVEIRDSSDPFLFTLIGSESGHTIHAPSEHASSSKVPEIVSGGFEVGGDVKGGANEDGTEYIYFAIG